MTDPSRNGARTHRVSARVRRRRRLVAFLSATALIAAIVVTVTVIATTRESPDAAPAPSGTSSAASVPSPAATPLTAAEALLATTDDPNACAVSFDAEGVEDAPMLQTQGALYTGLPIPAREGSVFAGWYATPDDAAARNTAGRLNGADLTTCTDRQTTLHGAWISPEDNAAEDARIPILMYHQFTTRPEGEDNALRGNFAYIGDFEQHIEHIATGGFYLPTWDELSAFIDGELFLPNHSVIVTDDDCDITWLELGMPVVIENKVLTTAFCITVDGTGPSPSGYVQQRSHTHDMHRAGANGKGRIVNLPVPEIVADMETSAEVLGVKQVMAYPFGHYNDAAKEALREAGFEMARTIEPGYVTIGTDKLAMPTVRVNYGMTVHDIVGLIG